MNSRESWVPENILGAWHLTPGDASVAESFIDEASDRFGAGRFRFGLPVDPGGDPRGQVGGDADAGERGYAGGRAAAGSFLIISY